VVSKRTFGLKVAPRPLWTVVWTVPRSPAIRPV
jgi:hypothetical protein